MGSGLEVLRHVLEKEEPTVTKAAGLADVRNLLQGPAGSDAAKFVEALKYFITTEDRQRQPKETVKAARHLTKCLTTAAPEKEAALRKMANWKRWLR
eukprot:890982-Amphidinium_carterae.1